MVESFHLHRLCGASWRTPWPCESPHSWPAGSTSCRTSLLAEWCGHRDARTGAPAGNRGRVLEGDPRRDRHHRRVQVTRYRPQEWLSREGPRSAGFLRRESQTKCAASATCRASSATGSRSCESRVCEGGDRTTAGPPAFNDQPRVVLQRRRTRRRYLRQRPRPRASPPARRSQTHGPSCP